MRDGVAPREVLAWAFLDFANSGYTTVVLTAVYSAYFVGVIAGAASWATLLWTLTVSGASFLTMLILPSLGLWADQAGGKRAIIFWASLLCGAATAALAWVDANALWLAVSLVALSSLAFNLCETFTAAFLRELARPHAYGRVSGWGWSFGYLGGMLTLGLSIAWVLHAKALGESATQFVPVTLWIVAIVYVAVSLPALAVLKERQGLASKDLLDDPHAPASAANGADAWSGGWLRLRLSWQRTESLVDLRQLLVCCVAYHAGISVVITLAAVYAEQVMGFEPTDTMILVFLVNIAAALGAFFFGRFQDRMGGRLALAITLVSWIVMVIVAVLGQSRESFWLAATLAGL
ncbi:MAG: MFS transporter, partial [Betaproteobacteria bacterium]|nr:MFS transporter [Betaproteobacteria bacterium]